MLVMQGSVLLNNALLKSSNESKMYECYNAISFPVYQITFYSHVVSKSSLL